MSFKGKTEKRSPFPKRSLPQAGESLQDAAYELFERRFYDVSVYAFGVVAVAISAWAQRWTGTTISPWVWTALAVVVVAFAAYRYYQVKPQLEQLRLGIRGERMVGRALDDLRKDGYRVFHDIPGDNFNVDHVLIGPGGVFVVETKTISKPAKGRAEVHYDGKTLRVNGFVPDRDPITQAEANARHIKQILKQMTSRDVLVRPVVLYPGWFVVSEPRECNTWVMNPDMLPGFLRKERLWLNTEDVALFENRLIMHLSAE